MSVLVLGGHECMEKDYKNLLREKGYNTKIYTKMPSGLKKKNWQSRCYSFINVNNISQYGRTCYKRC